MTISIRIAAVAGLLGLFNVARAAETSVATPQVASATFQDILSRVASRDAESGAILTVTSKADAPKDYKTPRVLTFTLNAWPPDEVTIALNFNSRYNGGVYEQYHLKVDDAINLEMQRQEKYQAAQAKLKEIWRVRQTKKIAELSGHELNFNMSRDTVRGIKGAPLTSKEDWSGAPNEKVEWLYADATLSFVGDSLQDVELVAPLPVWAEFAKLLGQPAASPVVQEFVKRFRLQKSAKGDSGSFSNYYQFPLSLLFRSGKISRVVVNISNAQATTRPIYGLQLPGGIQPKDKPSDVIRRLGNPESRSGNEWIIYKRLGLWLSFGRKTSEIAEINLDDPAIWNE